MKNILLIYIKAIMATGLKQKGNYNTGMNLITQPRDINPMLQHRMIKYVNQLQHNKKYQSVNKPKFRW